MEPAKINSLTHKPASRADAGAAPAARAGASLAAVHLIESALNPDAGTGNSPHQPDLASPHARAQAALTEHTTAPVAASGVMAPTPLPSANVEPESGVHVALSTQGIAAAANPSSQDSNAPPLPAALSFAPEAGAVAYTPAGQLPATPQSASAAAVEQNVEQKSAAQARDSERLAGLVIHPAFAAAPFRHTYDVIVLITVIVGALMMIFL